MNGATSTYVLYVNVLIFLYHALVLLKLEEVALVSIGYNNELLKVL